MSRIGIICSSPRWSELQALVLQKLVQQQAAILLFCSIMPCTDRAKQKSEMQGGARGAVVTTEHLAGMFGLSLPFSVCKVNLKYVECTKLYCNVFYFSLLKLEDTNSSNIGGLIDDGTNSVWLH